MGHLKTIAMAGLTAFMVGNIGSEAKAVIYTDGQIVEGNYCAGLLGTPPDCTLNGSGLIIKLNPTGTVSELGGFGSIDGSEFTLTSTGQGTGTWTYTPGAGDPSITGWTVKGGNFFRVMLAAGPNPTSGSYMTPVNPNNPNGALFGLSHITFFNGPAQGPSPIPLPAAAWLLLSGIGGLGVMGWRKRRAAA